MGLAGVNGWGWRAKISCGRERRGRFYRGFARSRDLTLPVGRSVVVIGGGMTAIDAAVQSKRLGAEEVTIVYRRGEGEMKASGYERELARNDGVPIRHFAAPKGSKAKRAA